MNRKLTWWTLLTPNSKLSSENKLLIYKVLLKRILSYGIQPWGLLLPLSSNITILKRLQSKVLKMVSNAPLVYQKLSHSKETTNELSKRINYKLLPKIRQEVEPLSETINKRFNGCIESASVVKFPKIYFRNYFF